MLLVIEGDITPSNNALLRMHPIQRSRLTKVWGKLVLAEKNRLQALGHRVATEEARKIKIIRHCQSKRQRIKDHDNLVGGLKPLIDAPVINDFLVDDSEEWLIHEIHEQAVDGSTKMEIRLSDL